MRIVIRWNFDISSNILLQQFRTIAVYRPLKVGINITVSGYDKLLIRTLKKTANSRIFRRGDCP